VTKGNPKWEQFEHEVQDVLDLRSTPGSGNQWHDPSDGRSRPDDPYKLMVDCKHTESASYSLAAPMLQGWLDKAAELGYRFALPVRMEGGASVRTRQWVAIPLDDYAELVDAIRILNGPKRCGGRAPAPNRVPCCRKAGHFGHHDNGEVEWA
jgi:hypothetical protein